MSDSDRRDPKGAWPDVERRTRSDRRSGLTGSQPRRRQGSPADDLEVRTPPPRRRDERRSGQERRDDSSWQAIPLDTSSDAPVEPSSSSAALVAAAVDARTRAQARYSGFKVGAALETADGTIVTGCNVENATYGLTLCAERVALVKALSDGQTRFTRIAVVADTADPTPPCGSCRQLLWEYCGDIEIVLANLDRTTATLRLSALLPMPFDSRLLE